MPMTRYWKTLPVVCVLLAAILAITHCPPLSSPCQASSPIAASTDADSDGLPDSLETEIGTDSRLPDTDGDGLGDYEEYCKYLTDPAKKDTDDDGTPDADWQERREYVYSVRAICRIRPPVTVEGMNDFYQDARFLRQDDTLEDGGIVELLLFPHASPHTVKGPYPPSSSRDSLKKYLQPTVSMNFSPDMQRQVHQLVAGSSTDRAALQKILNWISRNTVTDVTPPHWDYFDVIDGKIVWRNHLDTEQEEREFLNTQFYGESMFRGKIHGTCSSEAILTASMVRAIGIPTRLIQTFPLMGWCERDTPPLVDRMRRKGIARDTEWPPGANHMYNEVFIGNRWLRVDHAVGTGALVGGSLHVKCFSLADFNNTVLFRSKEEELYGDRQFRALDVSDALPVHDPPKRVDLVVSDHDMRLRKDSKGHEMVSVSIHNMGTVASPECDVHFCSGDPAKGGHVFGRHRAGPIEPGMVWNEGRRIGGLNLRGKIVVVIDPHDKVAEVNEGNNRAELMIHGDDKSGGGD